MKCDRVQIPGGGVAIVCSSRRRLKRCHHCGQSAKLLCDWKISKGKTCDMQICATHAQEVAPEKHLCPEHQKAYKEWLAAREPEGG